MKQHRVSLKDLAAQLGVSIATVSRALRNSHEVGEELRERVQKLAKELNYRPNPFAQSLRSEAPKVIGVVVPNLVTHYYSAVLDGIEDYASQEGYSVMAINSHEDYLKEEKAIIESAIKKLEDEYGDLNKQQAKCLEDLKRGFSPKMKELKNQKAEFETELDTIPQKRKEIQVKIDDFEAKAKQEVEA